MVHVSCSASVCTLSPQTGEDRMILTLHMHDALTKARPHTNLLISYTKYVSMTPELRVLYGAHMSFVINFILITRTTLELDMEPASDANTTQLILL